METRSIKNLKIFWMYYKKIFYPSFFFTLSISLFASGFLGFSIGRFAQSFFMIAPVVQFVQYALRLNHEYLFYANLGFSKQFLWVTSLLLNLIITFALLGIGLL